MVKVKSPDYLKNSVTFKVRGPRSHKSLLQNVTLPIQGAKVLDFFNAVLILSPSTIKIKDCQRLLTIHREFPGGQEGLPGRMQRPCGLAGSVTLHF